FLALRMHLLLTRHVAPFVVELLNIPVVQQRSPRALIVLVRKGEPDTYLLRFSSLLLEVFCVEAPSKADVAVYVRLYIVKSYSVIIFAGEECLDGIRIGCRRISRSGVQLSVPETNSGRVRFDRPLDVMRVISSDSFLDMGF